MALGVNTNLASMYAQSSQARTQSDMSSAVSRLSSGLRINTASDDAAGLAIASRFTAQLRGTSQAARNANDAISLTQTADGALASVSDNLQRMRELAVQSANATNSTSDRVSLQAEVSQLQAEIERVATSTTFNGVKLLDGSFTSKNFQVGANVGQTIYVSSIASARPGDLGGYQGVAALHQSFSIPPDFVQHPFSVSIGGGPSISLGSVIANGTAIQAAINNSGIPGLRMTLNPVAVPAGVSAASATVSGTATLTINGVAISIAGVTGAGQLGSNRSAAVQAINAVSAATGVVATDNGSGVGLTAADGRTVDVAYSAGSFSGSNEADFGLPPVATYGTWVNVFYVAPPGVSGNVAFTIGAYTPTFAIGPTGTAINAADVSTVAGADAALTSIDAALATVSSARASLGAVQNRVTSTIQNLQNSGQNLDAARSRVLDADFAAETSRLARAQVLQQAGNAMIAQANQQPALVLALLKA